MLNLRPSAIRALASYKTGLDMSDLADFDLRVLPKIGSHWRHFKGGLYEILGYDFDATSDKPLLRIHYISTEQEWQPLYSRVPSVPWSRVYRNFIERVPSPDDAMALVPRFEWRSNEAPPRRLGRWSI